VRICLVTRSFPGAGGPIGGGEVSVKYLAGFLAEAGHEVYVLTKRRSGRAESLRRGGINILYVLSDPKIPPRPGAGAALNWAANIPQLTGAIGHLRPDIVHSYSIDMLSRIQIALGEAPTPSIATINNHFVTCPFLHLDPRGEVCVRCSIHGFIGCLRSRRLPALAPFEKLLQLLRFSFALKYDRLTVLSEAHRRILVSNGFPPSRISVTPNFLNPEEFRERAEQHRRRLALSLGIKRGDRVVSFVGHLRRQKGVGYLIRAIPEILKALPETRFLIVGPGPERRELLRLADSMNLTGNVRFIPYIENARIPALYALSTIFAFPSIWAEPFGRVIIEAMAVGTPVIATGVGGVPEIIEDGRNGILVPPRDPGALAEAIISLLEDRRRRMRIGREGRRTVESRFTPEAVGPRILEIYEAVLAES